MEYLVASLPVVAYLVGAAVGICIMYFVIREAVKDGIMAADKARNKKA